MGKVYGILGEMQIYSILFAQILTTPSRSSMREMYLFSSFVRYFFPDSSQIVFGNFKPFSSFFRMFGGRYSILNWGNISSYDTQ